MKAIASRNGKTILCVDDDPCVLATLRRLLSPLPYRVLTTQFAQEALFMARNERLDLMILCLSMREMGGREVLKRLHLAETAKAPALRLTEDTYAVAVLKGHNAGVHYYITRPFAKEHVWNIVQMLLADDSAGHKAEVRRYVGQTEQQW